MMQNRLMDFMDRVDAEWKARGSWDESTIDLIPTWMKKDDPAAVNRLILAMCRKVVLYPDRVEFDWR